MANNIIKKVLNNGLTVIIKETRHAPVATFWMWYRTGSRNEKTGITGASHWVEHMQFKGTPAYPDDILDTLISREGGVWNAMTFYDWTAYYEIMPAEKIGLGLELEADRMSNSKFEEKDVEAERTVILSERSGSENSPAWLLYEELTSAAFRVHPYHTPVIGERADLENLTRADLYHHYQQHYVPGNATAVLVGDIDGEESLKRIEELFGAIPAGPPPPEINRPEPRQYGERRVTLNREGETAFVMMGYHAYDALHPDFFALVVLDSILAGASSMNFMSTAYTSSKTSRLYKALVQTNIAASVSGGMVATIDPYLYSISAVVSDGKTPREVEDALDAEIEKIAQGGISEAEFLKAQKQAKALFAYDSESVTSQGFWLGYAEILAGDYNWSLNYLENLMSVTLDDVKRAAADIFHKDRRTVGWYVPTGNGTQQGPE